MMPAPYAFRFEQTKAVDAGFCDRQNTSYRDAVLMFTSWYLDNPELLQ